MSIAGRPAPNDEPITSVDFEPRRVGSGRRASAVVVAVGAIGLVVVGLAKPWELGGPPPAVGVDASSPPAASAEPSDRSVVDARRLPRPGAVGRAIRPHDAWGVRLVVDADPAGRGAGELVEVWQPAAPTPRGSIPSLGGDLDNAATFGVATDGLRLVGLTLPPDVAVEDLTLIVGRPLGRAESVGVWEVTARGGGLTASLLRRDDSAAWMPGVYQFRFRLDGRLAAVTFAIFDAAGSSLMGGR